MSDRAALRPLGVGDILDEAFRVYRENFGYLVKIGLAAFGPVAVVIALLSGLGALALGAAGVALAAGLGGILSAVASVIAFNATTYAVDGIRRGRPLPLGQALRQGLGRAPAMVGLGLIVAFAIMLLLITIVGWIWLAVLWSLGGTVLLLEGGGITRALSRSRELVRGSWWRVFGILVLIWLISFFISFAIGAVGGLLAGVLTVAGQSAPVEVARAIVQALFNAVAQALSEPFGAAGTVLLYYDLRVRKEGLDLQERAEGLLAPQAPASPA
jgi:hypothetical protein